ARDGFDEALAQLSATGAPAEEIGQHTLGLAHCLMELGDREGARQRYGEAVRLLSSALGPYDPTVAAAAEALERASDPGGGPADEREAVLLWAMRALGDECMSSATARSGKPVAGAILVLAPVPGGALAPGSLELETRVTEGADLDEVRAWLRHRLETALAGPGAVMAGTAVTVQLRLGPLESVSGVAFVFEDAAGTF